MIIKTETYLLSEIYLTVIFIHNQCYFEHNVACHSKIKYTRSANVSPAPENNGLRSASLLKVTPAIGRPMRIWSDKRISTNRSTHQSTSRPEGASPSKEFGYIVYNMQSTYK